jgi:hypothetical protein
VLQSAALSLAAAHARLGHVAEALQALNEAVRIAQQAGDDACLAHALATLCAVLEATTPATMTSASREAGATPAAAHHAQLGQLLHRCLRWDPGGGRGVGRGPQRVAWPRERPPTLTARSHQAPWLAVPQAQRGAAAAPPGSLQPAGRGTL